MHDIYAKLACFSVVLMLLSACGTKGPLYIPEQQYPQDVPKDIPQATQQTAPQPAPASSY